MSATQYRTSEPFSLHILSITVAVLNGLKIKFFNGTISISYLRICRCFALMIANIANTLISDDV